MDESIMILGRQPLLGLAELECLYGAQSVALMAGGTVARVNRSPAVVGFDRIGGSIKLCQSIAVLPTDQLQRIESYLIQTIPRRAAQIPPGKFKLGISAYNFDVTPGQLLALGLRLKKVLHAKSSRTVRLVPNKSNALNSAQVIHNQLTGTNGLELILARDRHQTVIAQTIRAQDIAAYSQRDYGRPKRDARVGMLPPKLAQIMLNVATRNLRSQSATPETAESMRPRVERKIILDPFCGTGVILQEALLMGYAAYGTDIDPRLLAYSRHNLDWLATIRPGLTVDVRLEAGDATNMRWQPPIHAVASETYLGRPFTSTPDPDVLAQTVSECNLIIKRFLQNIHGQLSSGTQLCLAVPAWIRGKNVQRLPLVDHLAGLGYNLANLHHVRDDQLLYFRENQIVARQLLLITRNKHVTR